MGPATRFLSTFVTSQLSSAAIERRRTGRLPDSMRRTETETALESRFPDWTIRTGRRVPSMMSEDAKFALGFWGP